MAEPVGGRGPGAAPSGFTRELVLADGRRLTVRPVRPQDADALVAAVRAADPRDVRGRFGLKTDLLDDAALAELAVVDYCTTFRLLAFTPEGRIAASASYRVIPAEGRPPTAEVAVVVTPAFRRHQVAAALLRLLAVRASECGIEEFTGMAASANAAALELARAAGADLARAGDVTFGSVPVTVVLALPDDTDLD